MLKKIIEELAQYNHTRNFLREYYVEQRLNKNLSVYYKKLSDSVQFLYQQQPKRVLRGLNIQ